MRLIILLVLVPFGAQAIASGAVRETVVADAVKKEAARQAIYEFLGGEMTIIPTQLKLGVGKEFFDQMFDAEIMVGPDLVNLYGPRPIVMPVGVRARFWPLKSGKYFIELEAMDYFLNRDDGAEAFDNSYGVAVGRETQDRLRLSLGVKRVSELGDHGDGESADDFLMPYFKIERKFNFR